AGRFGPDGSGPGPTRRLKVVAAQGGGPSGLRAVHTDPAVPFARQLDVSADLAPPLDLLVWPEDVLQVSQPVGQTTEGALMAQLAARLGVTMVAGVVEDVGPDRFRNAAVAWAPTGVIVGRYDKVHRVPFGEYVPGRQLLGHLVNLGLVPRDAVAGRRPGVLVTPAGPLGVVISYEVFFEDSVRSAVRAGGQVVLVPTNASSYRTSQVPTQEVAAAQLRAWESGRDTIQAAPTGYSAIVDHNGRIQARSTLGRRQVISGVVTLRSGQTLFVRFGDQPWLGLALVGLAAAAWPWSRRPAGGWK
ncbi:MAG: apolipoprotein N-acyltransferase, partial [Actinomycetota bacterium]|nr:apolipoprotein N-acyltransferase [Actinomycetota bacterium]